MARRHVELWSALRYLCREMRARESVHRFAERVGRQPNAERAAVSLLSVSFRADLLRLPIPVWHSPWAPKHHGPPSGF